MPKKLLALADVRSRMDRRPLPRITLWSLVAVLLAASPAPGQDGRVMVDALILDRAGNPVPGLDVSDFEVIIGDRVRAVTATRTVAKGRETRRFVFVLNRRGATAAQLRRIWNQLTWSSTDSRRPRWQGRQRDIRVRRDDVGVVMQPTFFSVPPRLRSEVR